MERPLDLIELKVAEADYFLNQMSQSGLDLFAFHCNLSAFLSAARSITLTLQAVMRHVPGFNGWYESARRPLEGDVLARFFVERRNVATKTGDLGVSGGSMRGGTKGLDIRHYFDPQLLTSLPDEIRRLDVEAMAHQYMRLLIQLVSDWERWFYDNSGPGALPTAANTSPEELEKALGLPVGWTDGVGLSNEERIRILLRNEPPAISFEQLRSQYDVE
jgi:hypothetical protein